jgi:hypothetical protein
MARHFRPTGRIRRARSGDRAVDHAALERLLRLAEGDRDRNAADLLDEFGERLIVDPNLLALEVGQPLDRRIAEHDLRPERPQPQQLCIPALLQALVEDLAVGLYDLAGNVVVRVEADNVEAQEERLVARDLREPQRHHVEKPGLEDTQAFGILDADHVHRLVIHFERQAGLFCQVL